MVQPGTSQFHGAPTHPMHMASPMVVSMPTLLDFMGQKKIVFCLTSSAYLKMCLQIAKQNDINRPIAHNT